MNVPESSQGQFWDAFYVVSQAASSGTVIHGGNQLNHASLHWCSLLPPPASSPPWEWSRQQTPCTQILVGEFQNQTTTLVEMRQYSRDIHPKCMKPCYSFFLVRKNYPSFSICFFLAFSSLLFQNNGTVNHTFRLQLHGTRHGLSDKAMATHSSTLAWKIPWTEKPGRL